MGWGRECGNVRLGKVLGHVFLSLLVHLHAWGLGVSAVAASVNGIRFNTKKVTRWATCDTLHRGRGYRESPNLCAPPSQGTPHQQHSVWSGGLSSVYFATARPPPSPYVFCMLGAQGPPGTLLKSSAALLWLPSISGWSLPGGRPPGVVAFLPQGRGCWLVGLAGWLLDGVVALPPTRG